MIPGITAGQVMPHRWSSTSLLDGGSDILTHAGSPLQTSVNFAGTGGGLFNLSDTVARATFAAAGSMIARANYRNMGATLAGAGNALAWQGKLKLTSIVPFAGAGGLGPIAPTSAFSKTLALNGTIPSNSSVRQVVSPLSVGGNYVRVSFKAGTGTFGLSNVSIGIQDTTYNTVSTPSELLFNGLGGFSPLAAGDAITSDWAPLTFSPSDNLVVIGDAGSLGGNEAFTQTGVSGCTFYSKTSTNSYNVASPPGSWSQLNTTDFVLAIEAGNFIGIPISAIHRPSIAFAGTGAFIADIPAPGLVIGSAVFAGAGALNATANKWTTTFTATGGSNSAGWNGFNLRNVLPTVGVNGTKFRLRLFASTAASCTIDGLHAGHGAGGNSFNYDGTQVAVTVGGTQSFTINANTSVLTDEITYTVDSSKQFIVACHFNAVSAVIGYSGGATAGFKSAADESGTTTVAGYSTGVGNPWLVKIVEVFS